MSVPSSAAAPSAWSRAWALIILVSTIAVVVVTVIGAPEAIRGPVTVWFLVTCPGMALARLLGLRQPLIELMVGLALSLALTGLVASVFLYSGAWSPVWSLVVLVAITIGGLAVAPVPAVRDRRVSTAQVTRDHAHPMSVEGGEPPLAEMPPVESPAGPPPSVRPVFTLPSPAEREPDPEPLWVTLAAQRPRPEPSPGVDTPVDEHPPAVASRKTPARHAAAKPAAKTAAGKPAASKPSSKPATTKPKAATKPTATKPEAKPAATTTKPKPAATKPPAKQPTTRPRAAAKPAATTTKPKPAATKPTGTKAATKQTAPESTNPVAPGRTTDAHPPAATDPSPVEPSTPVSEPAPTAKARRRPGPRSKAG